MADGKPDMSPWTVTHGKATASSDLFDFDLALVNAPTTQQGRHIIDCEGHVFLQARLLGSNSDIGSFTIDPYATETIRPTESFYDLLV